MSQDEMYGISLGLCVMMAIFSAAVAHRKNRSMFGWSIAGLCFPISFIVLAFLDAKPNELRAALRSHPFASPRA